MSRTIYTERDIEDLARRGIKEIQVNETIYITDIAREKMEVLGIKAKAVPLKAASTARAESSAGVPAAVPLLPGGSLSEAERQQVIEKVRTGVIARLGPNVDQALLETIVKRVVGQL
jgi:hypothetical protein